MRLQTYGSTSVAVILTVLLVAPVVPVLPARAASLFELAHDAEQPAPAPVADEPLSAPATDAVEASVASTVRLRIVDNGLAADADVPTATEGTSVEQLLGSLGFTLAPEDVVYPSRATPAPTYGVVIIDRAAGVTLVHDGKQDEMKTRAATVAQLLAEKGVTLDDDDRVEPDGDSAVVPNLSVRVVRVSSKEVKEKESIEFATEDKDDATMFQGDTKVVTAGKTGEKELTYKLSIEDGKEVKKEKVGEKVLSKPTTQVTAHGTKPRPKTAETGPFKDLINAAAAKYGVDGAELMRVMMCESGGYQWAKDKSGTYFGLFQYTVGMYKAGPYGNRDIYDPEGQIFNTAYYWSIGRRGAWGC